jgi:membrane protein YdbS with pleckstrin-like domain
MTIPTCAILYIVASIVTAWITSRVFKFSKRGYEIAEGDK